MRQPCHAPSMPRQMRDILQMFASFGPSRSMPQPQLDVPVALPRPALRPRPDVGEGIPTDALQHLRILSHYRPDYDYRPDRYQYTETDTTDPDYVVFGVALMSPTHDHGASLMRLGNALEILTQAFEPVVHVSLEVDITGIPGRFFASARHTSTLRPDLSLWAGPPPDSSVSSYRYDRDGVPLLAVEVVSPADRDQRDNDWRRKMVAYARMGIREYWILDKQLQDPLSGFTLDAADGTPHSRQEYRLMEADTDGGMDSMILDASLRWTAGDIQCWQAGPGQWVRVADLPVMRARAAGKIEGEIKGELKTWGRLLHRILDAEAPGAADQVLQHWAQTAPPAWPSDETLDRLESVPGEWRSLLLGEPSPDNGTS